MAKFTTINLKGECFDEGIITLALNPTGVLHNCYGGVNVDTNNIIESMKAVSKQFDNSDELKLKYFILSFKQNELNDPYVADAIAKDIMDYLGKEYQATYAVCETDEIYINIVMNSISYADGHMYTDEETEVDELYWEVHSILEKYGIESFSGNIDVECDDEGNCKCTCCVISSITYDAFKDRL